MKPLRPGGAKSYVLEYRAGGGRRAPLRMPMIGKHGSPWLLEQPRGEAKRLEASLRQIAYGYVTWPAAILGTCDHQS